MNSIIALDSDNYISQDNGTRIVSQVIYVRPGESALLTLRGAQTTYELDEDKKNIIVKGCIEIKRVFMGPVAMGKVEKNCNERYSYSRMASNMLSQQEVTPYSIYSCGQPWSIDPCNNMKLIDVPGFYVAEVEDLSQFEELTLEYALIDNADAVNIKSNIRLGE